MNKVNIAEKEASEVLHSLLSVDRRLEKQEPEHPHVIVVASDSYQTNSTSQDGSADVVQLNAIADASGSIQWHTPFLGHTIFSTTTDQDQYVQQVAELENIDENDDANGMEDIYTEPNVIEEIQVTSKSTPKPKKKKTEQNPEQEPQNKLEDNPAQVKTRFKQGCECKDSCYRGLNPESVYRHRLNIAELTKSEHDMYLMGVTMACIADPTQTSRHKERRRLRASYVYQGRRVCLDAFLYLENVTHYQLKRIRTHVMTHGVAPRVHGNMGKKPYNTFSLDIYKHATEFLKQYLENHAATKDTSKPIVIRGDSRKNIFDNYKEYGEILEPGVKLMGYSTFRHFMKLRFPNVKFVNKREIWPKNVANINTKNKDKNKEKTKNVNEIQKVSDEEIGNNLEIQELDEGGVLTDMQQVIPLVVSQDNVLQNVNVSISQQPQQTAYLVTPIPHLVQTQNGQMIQTQGQTIVQAGGWYGR